MSRSFVAASSQYLAREEAVLTTTPITMACWFNFISITASQILIWIGYKESRCNYSSLGALGGNPGDPIWARAKSAAGDGIAATTT